MAHRQWSPEAGPNVPEGHKHASPGRTPKGRDAWAPNDDLPEPLAEGELLTF